VEEFDDEENEPGEEGLGEGKCDVVDMKLENRK